MSTGVYAKAVGDLVREALRAATITGSSMPVEESDFANGMTALNDVLAYLQTQGIHLWSETEALLPLNPDQQSYSLGVGGDHCFTDYHYTTAVATASGLSAIDVVSTSGMTAGDNIGIELSTGARQWTTILNVVDANSLTLNSALSASVNASASIYTYTNLIDQPIRILSARAASQQTYNELPIDIVSRQEYYDETMKDCVGVTNTVYYSRQLNQGVLSVWPVAQTSAEILRFTFVKPQYVAEDQSEDVLVPAEWFLPLKWAVAVELGSIYVIDKERQMMNEAKAARYMDAALSVDVEVAIFSIQPG